MRGKTGTLGFGLITTSGGIQKIINQGLVAADVPGGTFTFAHGQLENAGTLRADGAGARIVLGASRFTNTGRIEELNGGRVLINP